MGAGPYHHVTRLCNLDQRKLASGSGACLLNSSDSGVHLFDGVTKGNLMRRLEQAHPSKVGAPGDRTVHHAVVHWSKSIAVGGLNEQKRERTQYTEAISDGGP